MYVATKGITEGSLSLADWATDFMQLSTSRENDVAS